MTGPAERAYLAVTRINDAAIRVAHAIDRAERKGWLPGLPPEVQAALAAFRESRDRMEADQ